MGKTRHSTGGKVLGGSHPLGIWLGGGLAAGVALAIRLWAGSPHTLIHALGAGALIPPVWLLGLLWLAGFFLFGCAGGLVLCDRGGGPARSVWRFRGGMYFLLSLFLGLLWYPLLFRAQALWLSWLMLGLCIVMAVLCLFSWVRVRRICLLFGGLYILWLVFLFFLQLAVNLHG